MSARLELSVLRRELDRVLSEFERRHGATVELAADHYWLLETQDMFDLSGPAVPVVGQLGDDLQELGRLSDRSGSDLVPWHDLKHLIGLLEAVAATDLTART